MSVDIGQSAINAIVAPGKFGVIDAEEFQHGRMDVVDECGIAAVERLVSPLIALTHSDATLDAAAAKPVGKHKRIVISSLAGL